MGFEKLKRVRTLLYTKAIRAKQAKMHFANFVQRDQLGM